jgi:hypothetical protein
MYPYISVILFLSASYTALSVVFGWVSGVLGIFVLNIILCVIPGVFITYKASIKLPGLIWLWRLCFSALPLAAAVFFFVVAPEYKVIVSYVGVAIINFAIFYFVTYAAKENNAAHEAT